MNLRGAIPMRNKIAAVLFVALAVASGAALADGSGRYLKHNYTYTQKDAMVAAVFKPFLPRDDTILIGAMLELVNKVYGKHQIADLSQILLTVTGATLFASTALVMTTFFS